MKTEQPEENLNQQGSTTPDISQSSSSINVPDESTSSSCYFSKVRKSELEQKERNSFTKVSTNCGGNLVKWSSLLDTFKGKMFGVQNEMDLLAARGAAEYHDYNNPEVNEEVGNRMVCDQHLKELVTEWATTQNPKHIRKEHVSEKVQFKCGMPSDVNPHSTLTIPKVGSDVLTRDEAQRLLHDHHSHVHIGTPLCKFHKDFVSVAQCISLFESSISMDAPVSKRLRSAVEKYSTDSQSCTSDQVMDVDENYDTNSQSPAENPEHNDGVCDTKFFEWAKSLGIERIVSRKPFSQLSRRSKMIKASAMNKLVSEALELLAPGNSKELKTFLLDLEGNQWTTVRSELFEELMGSIVLEHSKLTTRKEKRSILSLVTSTLPYSTVLKYFPELTRYEYTKSRRYSFLLNRTPYTSPLRQKFVKEDVVSFIDFITSPLVRSDLPYGRRTLTKSDGTKLDISNSLRNVRAIEIVEMYIKMKTEKGEKEELMSRSTLYKILDKCKATTREALECVDYFISDALDSFENLSEILEKMKAAGYIDGPTEKNFHKRLHDSKVYLQTDFKLYLKFESKISDHCIKFALSDPIEKNHASVCLDGKNSHDHDKDMCERCQAIRDVFDDLINTVSNLLKSAKLKTLWSSDDEKNVKSETELTVFLDDVKTAEKNVIELKKHQVRNKHANHIRQQIIDSLQSNDAFLTLDWSQKVIPKQAVEPQSDYFGKSGISVHVTNALNIDKDGNLRQHNFVHITKHEIQDSTTVLLILKHVLQELKHVGILRVHLRSDNAGCYHSTRTLTSLPAISKKVGVEILSFTFSEAQGGKGAADRAAAEYKTKLRTWLGSGKNAETPDQLFLALTEGRFPKAMSSYLCSIDFSTVKNENIEIKGIQNMYDFQFNNSNSEMISRKFGLIGEGTKHDSRKFVAVKGTMTIETSGGYGISDHETFWKSSKCSKKCSEEDIEVQTAADEIIPFNDVDVDQGEHTPRQMESAVFECPEEGCTAVFTKYGNLERHLALGKHQLVPEKETLLDFAMERYAENIEGLREHSTPNTLKDALTTLPAGVLPFSNEKGWAIPSKKVYKKYNKDVVQFVMKKFEDSSKKKLKIYPKIIAKELREQKKDGTLQFAPDTWLNYKQISNLYHTFGRKSRELEEKKKKEKKTSKGNQSTGTQVPPTIPSSIRTPQNRASATRKPKTTSTGEESKTRSRRETTEELVDLVLEELNQKEYDDSEEIYDEISEENQDFYHLIEEIEKKKRHFQFLTFVKD